MNKKRSVKRGFRTIQALTILFVMVTMVVFAPQMAKAASIPGQYIFDISEGNIIIEPDGSNIKVTYGGGTVFGIDPATQIKIIGNTKEYTIVVDSDVICNIILEDVAIDTKVLSVNDTPFYIGWDAIVTLTLSGVNTLIADDEYAGLTLSVYGTLIIDGEGSLQAVGGDRAAGIGEAYDNDSGKLYINGGTIDATGGRGAAGIGGGVNGDFISITIRDSAFIKNAQGGDALDGGYGGGAGIGIGGFTTGIFPPNPLAPGWATGSGIITISSGVDILRVNGGATDGDWKGGASIGSGGTENEESNAYPLHGITFHNNEDPDMTQTLTYTINGGYSDAVLPVLAYIQLHNPAFTSGSFDNFWYETPLGGKGYAVGIAFRLTSPYDLYVYRTDREPKTGLD